MAQESIEKQIIDAAAHQLGEGTRNAIATIFGESAKELGLLMKDRVSFWRFSQLLNLFKRTQTKLEEARLPAQKVPAAVLFPLLESASLEEDDDLQDRWASLLATAATLGAESQEIKSYSEVLSQLSSREAKFFDAIYDYVMRTATRRDTRIDWQDPESLYICERQNLFRGSALKVFVEARLGKQTTSEFQATEDQRSSIVLGRSDGKINDWHKAETPNYVSDAHAANHSCDNLLRLRLIEIRTESKIEDDEIAQTEGIHITVFGAGFLHACKFRQEVLPT